VAVCHIRASDIITGCRAAKAIDPASIRRVFASQLGIVGSDHRSLFQQSRSTRKASFGGRVIRLCQRPSVSTDLMPARRRPNLQPVAGSTCKSGETEDTALVPSHLTYDIRRMRYG
jgi:hypothetical protein